MTNNFTKQDLQTGMMVQTRRGFYYHVFLGNILHEEGTLVCLEHQTGIELADLDTNLINTFDGSRADQLDILKVWTPTNFYDLANTESMLENGTLIWTRPNQTKL